MSATFDQLRDIFLAAVERHPPGEWDAYLDRACGGDAALRRQAAALLKVHADGDSVLGPAAERPAALAPDSGPEAGVVIDGRYKLRERVGEGGMGEVWVAEQTEPVKRLVAVKLIKAGMDTRQVVARFEAERQALALMDHANIARVLDGGVTATGRPYFVMELVKGTPITRYCDEARLTPRGRLGLFADVCQAVQHAHQKGVIHRDVKPSNVLVAPYDGKPVVKVIDFGVAKAAGQPLTDKTLYTGLGAVVGTPEYMSPEQAELNNRDIDTRSDIYSLGVILYELLTGTTPLEHRRVKEAGLLEALRAVREEETPRPSTRLTTTADLASIASNRNLDPRQLSRQVRGELDWIVMKALEKDRNRRYETANSLARDVQRYLADEPVQACPPSTTYRLRKFARRNRGPVLAAALVGLAVFAGLAGTAWQAVNAARERDAKQDALNQSRLLSAELALDKGQLLGELGDPNLALLWLARSLALAPPGALELQAAIRTNLAAWRLQVNSLRMVLEHDGGVFAIASAPNGQVVTAGWRPGAGSMTVRRWEPETGQPGEPQTFSGELTVTDDDPPFVLSPDTRYLLLGFTDGTTQLRDLDTGKFWETREKGSHATSAAFSPDGTVVLVGYAVGPSGSVGQSGKARLFDVATGNALGPELIHERPVYAAAFHPKGKSFVTECGVWGNGTEKVEARFWDLAGRKIREPLVHDCMALAVAFNPDGTKLLTGHWDYKAWLWDLVAREKPVVLQNGGPVGSVAFSPDGQTLLTGCYNGSVHLWHLGGRALGPPLRQGHIVQTARFGPKGESLLVGTRGNAVRVWNLAAGGRASSAESSKDTFFPLAFSPDRQTVLAREDGNTARLRDAATDEPLGPPLRHPGPVLIAGASIPPGRPHACSSDRRRALTVVGDNVARLWDPQTGRQVAVLSPEPDSTFFTAAFSPDSKVVVTGSFLWTADVWNAATGEHIRKLPHDPDGPVFHVAFQPGGGMLLTGGADKAARFWDPREFEPLGPPLMHNTAVFALAFSPAGQTVLTGDVDQNLQLWDVATRRRLFRLSGHRSHTNDAAFSPDGRLAVSGSQDHTARLWDMATGKPLGPPLPHPGPVVRVAFRHDGKTILTATQDQIARSWPVPAAMAGSPEEIELRAQVATGVELEADGSVRFLEAADWQDRRRKLGRTGGE